VSESAFDAEGLFDEDYLRFYAERIEELGAAETELIWRLLELDPGMEVLDLACGHGRIANRLAERGCDVTGLDATPLFLDRARQDADARGVTVDYVHGDMRDLPWGARFDRIVNWGTGFGYFDDPDNRRVIAQVARALRSGGRFMLELNNYASVLRNYQSSVVSERDGSLLVDRHRLDPLSGRNVVERTVIRDGKVRHVPFFVRLFTFPEIRDWLYDAGFVEVTGYGEDGEALTAESRRMLVAARR
jgi:SAM-dependent methyltransferase